MVNISPKNKRPAISEVTFFGVKFYLQGLIYTSLDDAIGLKFGMDPGCRTKTMAETPWLGRTKKNPSESQGFCLESKLSEI